MSEQRFFTYKGRPFVRCNDELYYGNMSDPYVIRFLVKSKKNVNGLDVAQDVSIALMSTDPDVSPRRRIIKTSEKVGLYNAMDIADIWLTRELAKAKKDN